MMLQSEFKNDSLSGSVWWGNGYHLFTSYRMTFVRHWKACDGAAKFIEDAWERPEGGGGKTRVISNGNVIEKGGVNTSIVFGKVTDLMRSQLKIDGDSWFACGLSLVIHPLNPFCTNRAL